jgi:hypothetical protein
MATEVTIPVGWKTAVCAILRTWDQSLIPMTRTAQNDWAATFPGNPWLGSLYDALIAYLSQPDIKGRFAPNMIPPGEAYEFIFTFDGREVLGKINLTKEGKAHIVSAHIPRKGEKL